MIVDVDIQQKRLNISYVTKTGDITIKTFIIPEKEQYNWVLTTNGKLADEEYMSWDNKKVKKEFFKSYKDRFTKWRVQEYLSSLPTSETSMLFEYNVPKIFFVDIEVGVDMTEGFPEPSEANQPVQLITISRNSVNIAMGTRELTATQIQNIEDKINAHFKKEGIDDVSTFKYFNLKNEGNLLASFFKFVRDKIPVMTGWNFIDFDWLYLRTRAAKIGVDARKTSKVNELTYTHKLPKHKAVVDYMAVYKKWDRSVKIKESIGLDYTASAVLGVKKIKYDGSLQDLYDNDFEKYVFYGSVDSRLVQLIHEKINTIDIFFQLAHVGKVQINDLKPISPIYLSEAAMGAKFLEQKRVFPKIWEDMRKKESYEGAFVFPATADLYEGVGSFDFKSLYPTTMRQYNISPESYVRNIPKGEENPDPEKYILTASGALFDRNYDSVFRQLLNGYDGDRQSAKKQMFGVSTDIDKLKHILEERKKVL